jgi:serine/threonine protein kinase
VFVQLDFEGNLKIGDLGIVKSTSGHTQMNTVIGTSGYMAPEVTSERFGEKVAYNASADVFGFGVVSFGISFSSVSIFVEFTN